jgi:molybdenum cofactor biosynthesis enzyme MoaA
LNLKRQAAAAIKRGNRTIELTGGEPTMLPFIEEFLVYLKGLSVRTSIITNGVVLPSKALSIINAGIDEFFISLHGGGDTHDRIVGLKGARKKQGAFLSILKERSIPYHFNFVITRHTAADIPVIVKMALKWRIQTISFVNFNPQQGWANDVEGTRKTVADLCLVGPMLDQAIETLEAAGIGVNVRFFPMCRLVELNRKNVCNNLHVSFDLNEWDYKIEPKSVAAHLRWGRTVS